MEFGTISFTCCCYIKGTIFLTYILVMAKDVLISGTWSDGPASVKLKLPLIIFSEEGTHVTYCPALDLSGYGNNEQEARDSFSLVLSEYLSYTIRKKTLASDLSKHGWKVNKKLRKGATPPSIENLLKTNEDFNRVFNQYDFKKTETTVEIPTL